MSVIEKAAKRLEELQRAGIEPTQVANVGSDDPASAATTVIAERSPQSRRREPQARAMHTLREPQAANNGPSTEHAVGTSHRVELNLAQIAAFGIVTPDAPRSRIADEFRVIKRPLIANAARKGDAAVRNGNLIMI